MSKRDVWNRFTKLGKPSAATWPEWSAWRRQAKAEHPIMYWCFETVPINVHLLTRIWITDPYWKVIHRIIPRYRYHVIKPKTLKPGYHDCREVMLHSMMFCLTKYFESGRVEQIVWEADERHQKIYAEMKELYDWWTKKRPVREDEWNEANPSPEEKADREMDDFFERLYDESERGDEYRNYMRKCSEMEVFWEQEDQKMLHRLVDLRLDLW